MKGEKDVKSRASVSREMWDMHLLKLLQKGGTRVIIWPKRAKISKTGISKSPCPLANAKLLRDSGYLEEIGISQDGDGVVYCLKEKYLLEEIMLKRKPSKRSRNKLRLVQKAERARVLDDPLESKSDDDEDQEDLKSFDDSDEDLTPSESEGESEFG